MQGARRTVAVFAATLVTGVALAGEAPVTVSPGDAKKLDWVESRCPTFSWGEVEGAKSYELVVYRVGEEGDHSEPVLRRSFRGAVETWTPSLSQCLERGGRYAWSVRAVGAETGTEWSAPKLFEVLAGPGEGELEAALDVVKSYLAVESKGAESVAINREAAAVEEARRSTTSGAPGTSAAPAPTQLSVDGNVDATSFTGDGSNLAGVATNAAIDALQDRFDCPGAAFSSGGRFVDCGNGTIRDMNTGKIWLKDANCQNLPGTNASGQANWENAKSAAAQLKDGICGLTDGSLPGQWRLPEAGDFCSRDAPTPVGGICPAANATDSLVNTNFSSPTLSNSAGLAKWTADGDAFIRVRASAYWTATEYENDSGQARHVSFSGGDVDFDPKGILFYVWPVRGGQ